MNMNTRNNEGIKILLVEPLGLERVIHKYKRAVDIFQAANNNIEIQVSNDTVQPKSNDRVHPVSKDTMLFKYGGGITNTVVCFEVLFYKFLLSFIVKKEMMNFFNFTYYLTTL